ncbi:MAG: alpha/beta hydrolase [Sphingobacteriales bacterium]|jgi:hypothetical protein|nr:MAG: alpha/beta hydrolase [Sphingobacteriales bacterium]
MKHIITTLALVFFFMGTTFSQAQQSKSKESNKMENIDHYTFQLNEKVTRKKVNFKNRYGIILVGDLYTPKNIGEQKLPALVICGPFGTVKEQSSGLYANELATRGFIVLAFDPSYTGESSGEPRNIASPDISTEDFSAAVDFIGLQNEVDRNKIGIIGICGFGGFALNATAVDKRVKAVATTSMYDISRVNAEGYFGSMTPEQRTKILEEMSLQRWEDAKNGTPKYPENGLGQTNEKSPQFVREYYDYYKTDRGFHERSLNSNGAWTATNAMSFMNMPLLTYIKEIAPRPILLIAGENAHSRYMSEDTYKNATEPKELLIIPNAVHVDLYDKMNKIPFDKLESFFKENLK